MRNRIVLVGKGASGKNFLVSMLRESGYTYFPSYTTRPPRKGEVDGVDYHFISDEVFNKMLNNREFYEFNKFEYKSPNGDKGVWLYGRTLDQFNKSKKPKSVMIMTPSGVNALKKSERDESVIVFLDIVDEILEDRLISRSDGSDSYLRRLESDRKDFKYFTDYDVLLMNPEFTLEEFEFAIDDFRNDIDIQYNEPSY